MDLLNDAKSLRRTSCRTVLTFSTVVLFSSSTGSTVGPSPTRMDHGPYSSLVSPPSNTDYWLPTNVSTIGGSHPFHRKGPRRGMVPLWRKGVEWENEKKTGDERDGRGDNRKSCSGGPHRALRATGVPSHRNTPTTATVGVTDGTRRVQDPRCRETRNPRTGLQFRISHKQLPYLLSHGFFESCQ